LKLGPTDRQPAVGNQPLYLLVNPLYFAALEFCDIVCKFIFMLFVHIASHHRRSTVITLSQKMHQLGNGVS